VSASDCGNSSLPGREGETLGFGFSDLGLGAQAEDLVPGLRDEYVIELFCNLRIAPG
jgi:hypothetical protein